MAFFIGNKLFEDVFRHIISFGLTYLACLSLEYPKRLSLTGKKSASKTSLTVFNAIRKQFQRFAGLDDLQGR